ncbi:MAG: hypothetical protein VKM97_04750 [Cyanobacteriota bacterium]|nr:hypothetical protein [Cyanobacteriota bacterium]
MTTKTIRDYKRARLADILGERVVTRTEVRVLEILRSTGYPARCREDFYVGVLKSCWEYRDVFEKKELRLRKELPNSRAYHPFFVKVSYNFYLADPLENPLGQFDLNGMVVDMVRGRVVYPGMSRVRQLTDMEVIQGIIADPSLRCSVMINPPRHSPLLTFFCIPGLDRVFVQYGTTSCVRSLSHAVESIPNFEDFLEPIVGQCACMEESETEWDVEQFLRETLFLFNANLVMSVRCINELGEWSVFLERAMVFQGRFWENLVPGSLEEAWVDMCLETRYPRDGKLFLEGRLSYYVDDLVKEWRGYGDETGRFVPLQDVRIVPEEVGVLGNWETYTVIFEPTYNFQKHVYETLYPSLGVIRKEHGDVLDGISFLGTPPSKKFAESIDKRTEKLLSDSYGVWYHWKDVAFPIAQFWVKDEGLYLEAIEEYAYENGRNRSGILRSESNLYFCRRLLSYYLCVPPCQRDWFEQGVAGLFAQKAILANVLHNQDLPCSSEIKNLRKKFEHCRSLGARKFAVGKFVSELSWEDVSKITI